jgi:hypothetical protein
VSLQANPLPEWLHIVLTVGASVAGTVGSVFLYLLKEKRKIRNDLETERRLEKQLADSRHIENTARLITIETMLKPIWRWWNNGRTWEDDGEDHH